VAGKGLPAALLMANLQASVRAFGTDEARPETVTRQVNRALCRHTPLDRFVTFVYATIDTSTRTLTCSNAGHNPPILVHGDGSVSRPTTGGMVLGVLEDNSYAQDELRLQSGDRLLLFTDGITEAGSHEGREFGDDRLVELVVAHRDRSAPELLDTVFREVSAFTGGMFADDATLISVAIG
jgi:sigma-B regulation protein RsbU (phosphoserine phosphatase)